ncbi:MAG TPA: hypothetical protein VK675_02195 [Candidatus Paceibacterota bacterium]|nr:hypothetical protein [Candidatus Paceibacterota bacterium]
MKKKLAWVIVIVIIGGFSFYWFSLRSQSNIRKNCDYEATQVYDSSLPLEKVDNSIAIYEKCLNSRGLGK